MSGSGVKARLMIDNDFSECDSDREDNGREKGENAFSSSVGE